jgi:imidazolonepropionase-like amidohydrolase
MSGGVTVLRDGFLIDGTGAPPSDDSIIVVRGSLVQSVGKKGKARIPKEAKIIECDGKTVMPGMIDSHVHLASVVGLDPDASTAILRTPPSLLTLHAAKHSQEMLEAGFTAVRDMGGLMIHSEIVSLRDAVEMGLTLGPRIVVAGWVEMTAGHGDIMNNWFPTLPRKPGDPFCADGPWEIRKRIREFSRERVDQIKTASSGDPPYSTRSYTLEELQTLVDEAHSLGMKVACHSWSADGNMHALNAGVDTLEHGLDLDEEATQTMVKNGTILVPTLSLTRPGSSMVSGKVWPEPERLSEERSRFIENCRRAHEAGVKIAMGSDTYRILRNYWGKNAFELELMTEAGMSNMEAIASATKIAAEALGLEHRIGTIEAGKLADIIVVDDNPLDDIRVLQDIRNIEIVIKGGAILVDRR